MKLENVGSFKKPLENFRIKSVIKNTTPDKTHVATFSSNWRAVILCGLVCFLHGRFIGN